MPQTALKDKINKALELVRPHLEADGGNVEIAEITNDGTLKIKWTGNCENCFMSEMTLKAGIEQTILINVPEIKKVIAINGVEIT